KVRALESLKKLSDEEVQEAFVRGQYSSGEAGGNLLRSYREEDQVEPDSETETFVAGKITVQTERWDGVPFYIRTGKRMLSKTARVDIVMKNDEINLFEEANELKPNVLTLHLDPEQGWSFQWNNKNIGPGFPIKTENLSHFLSDDDAAELPEAYEKLLLDALNGDTTNFAHWE